ncbi:MAG: 16S rRNA (cytosine(1402)-N(4))-methyltransferase RsmH [Alphaproteobacteria bacterium]|jgi:16S rRNA (cytosine1402-N4)-methyltransferase|nr:16S rRNA (cytosine(1402)-N(4))-methyltransferase RsmH [Candidatus Jidaibacter sp.]
MKHVSVLLEQVLKALDVKSGGLYLDCTFGAGGYTKAILSVEGARVCAIDRDSNVLQDVESLRECYGNRLEFYLCDFGGMDEALAKYQEMFDGIVFDIGVSSMQIDQGDRGFSFQQSGPLDMRMDSSQELDAKYVVNHLPEKELASIIREYGDEKRARIIAKNIVNARKNKEIETTSELSDIIRASIPYYKDSINPATRTFQAIRIFVNDELNQLKKGLLIAKSLLKPTGVLAVVTFHSGEDVIVKKQFDSWCGKVSAPNRYLPQAIEKNAKSEFVFVHKGIVIAGEDELENNPRARSAKLRAVKKCEV